ncbi:uncharacterized protein METZ01_LOCUS39683 [marine metagenome]|uniref:Uncharacterized protein n=1 Tax=marine metagenome TaxID=408172 RepID=A0A381R7Q1_9ZZZZ
MEPSATLLGNLRHFVEGVDYTKIGSTSRSYQGKHLCPLRAAIKSGLYGLSA